MVRLNQNGDAVFEDVLYGFGMVGDSLTDADRDKAIALLCERIGVKIVRTNATKHGTTEVVLHVQPLE